MVLFNILGGIIFILLGILYFKKPDLIWKLQLFCNADEPSKSSLFRIKIEGVCFILAGTICVIFSLFLE